MWLWLIPDLHLFFCCNLCSSKLPLILSYYLCFSSWNLNFWIWVVFWVRGCSLFLAFFWSKFCCNELYFISICWLNFSTWNHNFWSLNLSLILSYCWYISLWKSNDCCVFSFDHWAWSLSSFVWPPFFVGYTWLHFEFLLFIS
jgi:hypothetical protein